jgi:DNA-binding MarR family transcriptional regulator
MPLALASKPSAALRSVPEDPLEGEPLEDHRASVHALRRLLIGILEPFGLGLAEYKALRLASKGPARPSAVSYHAEISPSATTELLDRLEQRGLIARSPDPSDRRATLITLTRRGDRLQREAAMEYRKFLDGVTGELTREGLVSLQKGARELRTLLERRLEQAAPSR